MKETIKRELHLELLLGRDVLDRNGEQVGRIEEVIAEQQEGDCVVSEFHVGRRAALERLSVNLFGRAAQRLFGAKQRRSYRIAWDKMDWSDTERPRLLCAVSELETLDANEEPRKTETKSD